MLNRRRQWHPTPVFLPGKSHRRRKIPWRSLVGCIQWGREESGTTERLHFHFSLSCIGEEMATHFSVLAWRIPGTGEPGGVPSMGSHRVGHDWSDLLSSSGCWMGSSVELKEPMSISPPSSPWLASATKPSILLLPGSNMPMHLES